MNYDMVIKGDKLIITVVLTERHGLSSTGKSETIASSHGNVLIPGGPVGAKLGLNVFVPVKK